MYLWVKRHAFFLRISHPHSYIFYYPYLQGQDADTVFRFTVTVD